MATVLVRYLSFRDCIREYYEANPKVYLTVEDGEWQTRWVFMGEVVEVKDVR